MGASSSLRDTRSAHLVKNYSLTSIPERFFESFYKSDGRDFPWRDESIQPFGVTVAELFLKRTQAANVASVWPSFIRRFESFEVVAKSDPEDLFESIAVLGLGGQRTNALKSLATAIVVSGGSIPKDPDELMNFPFIGLYTSHAIACFAFGKRYPILDLSILRFVSRYTGIEVIKDIRRVPEVWDAVRTLLPDVGFKDHNYGMLDFAALICKFAKPRCSECALRSQCNYGQFST